MSRQGNYSDMYLELNFCKEKNWCQSSRYGQSFLKFLEFEILDERLCDLFQCCKWLYFNPHLKICKQSVNQIIMMYLCPCACVSVACVCTYVSHVLVWKARYSPGSISWNSYQQSAEKAEWFPSPCFAIVHAKHCPRLSGGKATWRLHLLLPAMLHWCEITLIVLLVRTG